MSHRTLLFLRDDRAGARSHAAQRDERRTEHTAHDQHAHSSFHDQADGAGGFVDQEDAE